MMSEQQCREKLIQKALELNRSGLSQGKSGNLSIRFTDGMLITPSGIDYHNLSPADIVYVDHNYEGAEALNSDLQPSSEWHFHQGIYLARDDVQAVVHAHPIYSTALACTGRAIPAFHYMVGIAGGMDIPIAPYAVFGTQMLSDHVVAALTNRQACLLETHGMIAIGDSLDKAFNLAQEVEVLAQQYCEALKLGNVKLLSDEQMKVVLDKFKNYGQRL